jgi:hypothetical protein
MRRHGNAVLNYNAEPLPAPALYDIADFQPGGVYAIAAGSAYHYFTSSQSFNGVMNPGLYYITGDVDLYDVRGAASIVATGHIRFLGSIILTTYDARFPLVFTSSPNMSSGAIGASNPNLDLTGDFYAPNGAINISGAQGSLRGRVYAKAVSWDASPAIISCPICDLSGLTLSLQKSVTPTVNVPYHGDILTFSSIVIW